MRASPLHHEFYELQGKVHYVVERVRGSEWSSSCPQCGGEPHQSGEWPDRFRMWPGSSSKIGAAIGWCRACGYKWTQKQDYKPSQEQIEQWRIERIKEEERRKQEAEAALEILRSQKQWEIYNQSLEFQNDGREYWITAGIRDSFWWDEWQLGYDREHSFWYDNNGWVQHKSPTATMAVRNLDGEIINIKHRLLQPQPNGVKYRMEYKVGLEPIFMTNLELGNKADTCILAEGEKKIAVAWLTLDEPSYQGFGLPLSPSEDMLKSINSNRIYYIPDPDAKRWQVKRVIEAYRDRDLFIVRLPEKIDDMINLGDFDKTWMRGLLNNARAV